MVVVGADRPQHLVDHLNGVGIAAQRGYWPSLSPLPDEAELSRIVALPRDTTEAERDTIKAEIRKAADK